MRRFFLPIFFCGLLSLVACDRRGEAVTVTPGPISATGTLVPAEVALVRRGSHVLMLQSKAAYYVESKTENLREYEGRTVFIEGRVEPNTRREDLPVIVVDTITSNVGNDGLKIWKIPALNIRIAVPDRWSATIKDDAAEFTPEEEENALLRIWRMSGSALPPGTSFYVRNRPAVRTEPESGTIQQVYVLEKDTVIGFHFDPSVLANVVTVDEGKILTAQFERILSDMTFLTDTKLTEGATGSGSGIACGGPAGLLCAQGYYCDVAGGGETIGVCKNR